MFPDDGEILSGGNFHGQPLSLPLDHLALALCELASFSERRIYALLSPGYAGLPPFLTPRPGLSSGLMIAQYAAAALVNECQVLSHPAGAGSIPTSAGQEDFNSMGATAALKARTVIENAAQVVATELVCAVQGLEFHRPLRTTRGARGGGRARAGTRRARRGGPVAGGGSCRDLRAGAADRGGGAGVRCRGWVQEAALRMLENNLHPDVAERPEELVVYGGIGKAARNQACLDAIKRELMRLGDRETLLVQSGKPVGVFETHPDAPRVLIANSNLVPEWATWRHFRELDAAGLMMYGQMTAGSWIYIGTQGILQGTYETFAALARLRFGGSLRGPAGRDRRARRDGRRPAAGGDDERRLRAVRRGRPAADRAPDRDRLPGRARRVARRRARSGSTPPRARAARSRSACSATPPRCCRSSPGAARTSTS